MALRRKSKDGGTARRTERKAVRKRKTAQVRAAFTMTRRSDPKMLPIVLGIVLAVLLAFVLIGFLVGHPIYFSILGLLAAAAAGTIVFSRRAQAAAFGQVEGQPGAAAAVLQSMRGDWRVTPAVEVTRTSDLVHRVVGRPGVILVAEGGTRTRELLIAQGKKVRRVIGETPVYEVVVGDADQQVPLRKLSSHLTKLPRNLKPAQVNTIDARLKAINLTVPMPKGPLPKGLKMPRGKMR